MQIIRGKIERPKKVVIYGPEGVGKSTLAAQFPAPIFIDTEGSTTEMDVPRLERPTSWTMLNTQIDWVKQNGIANGFKSLVIDTVDWAEALGTNHICAVHNKNGVEDFGYGNGYVYAKEEFGKFLNKLSEVIEAGLHVVLNAHSQIVKFEQPDEMGAYDRYQLKLGKKTSSQTAPLLKEWADMLLFCNYKTISVATDDKGKKFKAQGNTRMIYATHHASWDAKNRHGLPDSFSMDYSQIAHIFSTSVNNVQSPVVTPVNVATHTPVQPVTPVLNGPGPIVQPTFTQVAHDSNQEMVFDPKDVKIESYVAPTNPAIPKALFDLMVQHEVTEEEVVLVAIRRGIVPQGTPFENIDPGYVQGVLVACWPQVFDFIENDIRLPY